ncbi:MAG: ROK family transcriptional regulator [Pseudomonadota bacterium]
MAQGEEPGLLQAERGFEHLGSNASGMRAHNERLVLSVVRRHGALSKADIARMTGLSAQTVSVIMRALEDDGLLERGEKIRGKVGQPSIPMRLAPDGAFFLGLKVGRRSAELLLVDFLGNVRARAYSTYAYPTPDGTLDFVKSSIKRLTSELAPNLRARIAGLGIAIPFFLWEWASMIGVEDDSMEAWRDFDLRAGLQDFVTFPVFVENDVTSACGAELVFGTTEKPQDFLYIYMGYFIGGGLVLNGNLFTGPNGNSGAIGPMPTDGADGPSRQLVDVASLGGLETRFYAAGGTQEEMWGTPGSWSVPDDMVADWLDDAARSIAHAITCAISVVDVSAVILDGSIPLGTRADLVDGVGRHLDTMKLSGLARPAIIEGSIGTAARSLGAASLPLSKRFILGY